MPPSDKPLPRSNTPAGNSHPRTRKPPLSTPPASPGSPARPARTRQSAAPTPPDAPGAWPPETARPPNTRTAQLPKRSRSRSCSILRHEDGHCRSQIQQRIDLEPPVLQKNLLRAGACLAFVYQVKITEHSVKEQRERGHQRLAMFGLEGV